jgi:catechol 2,3-dioxygenase-like lactoylglutathione lyase family enzyme
MIGERMRLIPSDQTPAEDDGYVGRDVFAAPERACACLDVEPGLLELGMKLRLPGCEQEDSTPVSPHGEIVPGSPAFEAKSMGSFGGMQIETLDHVALWVDERDALADFLVAEFAMHVVERTDKFTLVGGDARRGKLTLFAAEGPRERGVLAEIGIRVPAEIPAGDEALSGPGGVPLLRQESEEGVADLDHVTFRVPDPDQALPEFAQLGFAVEDGKLKAGDSFVLLEKGEPEHTERPLLNHLGLRVESADRHLEEAKRRGLEIADVVDAENTYAVFVWGPERIKLEYVEHKPSFSLV